MSAQAGGCQKVFNGSTQQTSAHVHALTFDVPACRGTRKGSNHGTKYIMSYPHHELMGALDSTLQFITDNTATLTAKGLTPANLTTAINALKTDLSGKDGIQENAKTALKNATLLYEGAAGPAYDAFSSMIDLMSGAVGKTTPLAKQARNIRTKLNKKKNGGGSGGSGSSSSSSSSGGGSSSSSSGGGGSSSSS
jgi:hypothetical protein